MTKDNLEKIDFILAYSSHNGREGMTSEAGNRSNLSLIWEAENREQELQVGQGYKVSSSVRSDVIPPAKLHLLMVA